MKILNYASIFLRAFIDSLHFLLIKPFNWYCDFLIKPCIPKGCIKDGVVHWCVVYLTEILMVDFCTLTVKKAQ